MFNPCVYQAIYRMYQALIRYIYIAIRNAHSDVFHMAIEAIFYLQTSTYARTAYTKVSLIVLLKY